MKIDLHDVTFVIVIRLDSIQRLENLLVVIEKIHRYFKTNIVLLQAEKSNNGVLKKLLSGKVLFHFIEDKDPVFHRTKYFNVLVKDIETPIIGLWDADVVIDKDAILDSINCLRKKNADVAYPYNGLFFETSEIMREFYMKKKSIKILYKNLSILDLLYNHPMVGGALFINKEAYLYAGLENEKHYGWGNDDFDRYYRFLNLGLKIYRTNNCLFHLTHPRGDNSQFRSVIAQKISTKELFYIENSSKN